MVMKPATLISFHNPMNGNKTLVEPFKYKVNLQHDISSTSITFLVYLYSYQKLNFKMFIFLAIPLGFMISSTFGCDNPNELGNCRVLLGQLCAFAPAGGPRDTCFKNRDGICLKNVCKCREGWILDTETGSCYKIVMQRLNWNTAKARCASLAPNAKLAIVKNSHDENFIKDLLKPISTYLGFWLGGSDSVLEGKWSWVDGSLITYTDWHRYEPNNNGNQDCLMISSNNHPDPSWTNNMKWDDLGCGSGIPSLCQY